jgi:hypothetical protein
MRGNIPIPSGSLEREKFNTKEDKKIAKEKSHVAMA